MVAAGRMSEPTFQRRKLEPISAWIHQAGNEITEGWTDALIVDVFINNESCAGEGKLL